MMDRTIFETKDSVFRIVEVLDSEYDLENLKGDVYNPKLIVEMGYTGTVEDLKREELEFERLVSNAGVFGYVLERWNPAPGIGYEHIDSCFGFVGQYEDKSGSNFNHYIVAELKRAIQDLKRGVS